MTSHPQIPLVFDLISTKFASRTSLLGQLTGFFNGRRNRTKLTAIYADLLQADDYRLADLGVTRHDVLRLLGALNRT